MIFLINFWSLNNSMNKENIRECAHCGLKKHFKTMINTSKLTKNINEDYIMSFFYYCHECFIVSKRINNSKTICEVIYT